MNTASEIFTPIGDYFLSLDWVYIITLIILCYGLNKFGSDLKEITGKRPRTRYRVLFIGLVYGSILYFIRGREMIDLEKLFSSLVFTMVFHKLIVESFLYWIVKKGFPEKLARHFMDDVQLKKFYHEKRR